MPCLICRYFLWAIHHSMRMANGWQGLDTRPQYGRRLGGSCQQRRGDLRFRYVAPEDVLLRMTRPTRTICSTFAAPWTGVSRRIIASFFSGVDMLGYSQDGNPNNDRACDRVFRGRPLRTRGRTCSASRSRITTLTTPVRCSAWSRVGRPMKGATGAAQTMVGSLKRTLMRSCSTPGRHYLAGRLDDNPAYAAEVDAYAAETGLTGAVTDFGAPGVDPLITGPHSDGEGNPCVPR